MEHRTHLRPAFLGALIRNLVPILALFVLTRLFVRVAERVQPETLLPPVAEAIAYLVAGVIALKLRARPASYGLAALIAFSLSELAIHARWGISAAQGAPTHFAVLGSAAT